MSDVRPILLPSVSAGYGCGTSHGISDNLPGGDDAAVSRALRGGRGRGTQPLVVRALGWLVVAARLEQRTMPPSPDASGRSACGRHQRIGCLPCGLLVPQSRAAPQHGHSYLTKRLSGNSLLPHIVGYHTGRSRENWRGIKAWVANLEGTRLHPRPRATRRGACPQLCAGAC